MYCLGAPAAVTNSEWVGNIADEVASIGANNVGGTRGQPGTRGNGGPGGNGGIFGSNGSTGLPGFTGSFGSVGSTRPPDTQLGGGLFVGSGGTTLTNATFVANASADGGGAITGATLIKNSIIFNNSPDTAPALATGSGQNQFGMTDPLFLQNPDLPTNDYGDLRLQLLSPALDAGDDLANTEPLDLDGNTRFSGAAIDLGPYEFQQSFATRFLALDPDADDNGNGFSNYFDYAAGADPTALHDPGVSPTPVALDTFTHTLLAFAGDVHITYEISTDLVTFTPMVEGIDFTIPSEIPLGGARYERTVQLTDTGADRIFYRYSFSTEP